MKYSLILLVSLLALVGCGTGGQIISNIQTTAGNWQSWGQLAPDYVDCASPCSGINWSMKYGVASPSLSGNATEFRIAPNAPYADTLFSAQLIGQNSPQLPDAKHTLLPTLHHFVYDTEVYVTNLAATQVLEFDVSMYQSGIGMIWGHQCNHLGDGDWDIWDNVNAAWMSTGIPCKLVSGWNRVTIMVERQPDNSLLYQSITLNGTTNTVNKTYPAGTAPEGWWGVTANYQMDGNASQSANQTYLDNFSVGYL